MTSRKKKLILAIDQGTTGSKAILVDEDLNPQAEATVDFEQHFPKPGWVEHDLNQIWSSVVQAIVKALASLKGADASSIVAIGITNQRETICFWDRATGEPLSRAIVWQDRRTADVCQQLIDKGTERFFQDRTGLVVDPYFSGTKVAWALKNWPELRAAHQKKTLAVGTIDSYLIARLAGGGVHLTEPSNASRTLCFHLTQHRWDLDLCNALSVPADLWPEVRPSVGLFATTQGVPGLPDGIPITGVLGDQQSALLGQACIEPGMAKCTYGTGAFLLLNTGNTPAKSRHRLLTTIAWSLSPQSYTYALEGSAFVAGAATQWLRDGLKIISSSAEIEPLARSVETSEGVVFVPSLTGLGAPHWNATATGMITGITRGTTRGHIARAALEGIAFQNADILSAMQKDLGKPLEGLNVDGGASANDLLIQFQADLLGVPLKRPKFTHTTSMGAVFAAGLGVGLWSNLEEISKSWKEEKVFNPQIDEKTREQHLRRWQSAVARVNLSPKI